MDSRVPVRNCTQNCLRSVRELKNELRRLANLIADEEDDFCEIEVFDRLSSTVSALRRLKFDLEEKNSKKSSKPKRPLSEKLESLSVPECFLCPISSEIMTDPVMLATGQTYDRPYIQTWLDADHRTCPKTQQVLPHVILTPNYLVRSMIEQWCESQGLDYPSRTSTVQGDGIMPHDIKYLNILLDKLSGHFQSQRREAVRELRALTKKKHSHRVFLGEPRTIALLIPLLQSDDAETQEHTVTAFFNLSIHEANKALIAKEGAIEPVVKVLRSGHTMAARENAAATLFSLSALDENKAKIGASGAIPALVELLQDGKSRGKKDAASALFNLCISHENRGTAVKTGLVAVLFKMIGNEKDGMRDESLAILALLAGHREGAAAIAEIAGFIPILMAFIKKTTSSASASASASASSTSHSTENAVVILAALCGHDPSIVKELRSNDGYLKALVSLSMGSSPSRSRRKAAAIVERINKQLRSVTI